MVEEVIQDKPQQPAEANDTERWASLIGGGAMVLMGLRDRSLRGVITALAGGGLIYQGMARNSTIQQVKEALAMTQTIKVEKSVTINKPADELYRYWHNFENLPSFMKHLQHVKVYNDTRSHWIARAPLGGNVEWDADIIQDEPNQLIAWTSVEGSDIDNSGFVRFQPAPGDRGTEVKIVMEYAPPGGALASTIAKLFGEAPEQQLGDELRSFKQLMEAGEIATTEGQPTCRK